MFQWTKLPKRKRISEFATQLTISLRNKYIVYLQDNKTLFIKQAIYKRKN